jgi:hypothetical protein
LTSNVWKSCEKSIAATHAPSCAAAGAHADAPPATPSASTPSATHASASPSCRHAADAVAVARVLL